MPGIANWDPLETPRVQLRDGCSILTVDCGNGVCCPLGSKCVAASGGGSSCAAGVSGLGSLTVPGLGSRKVFSIDCLCLVSYFQSRLSDVSTATAAPTQEASSTASSGSSSSGGQTGGQTGAYLGILGFEQTAIHDLTSSEIIGRFDRFQRRTR